MEGRRLLSCGDCDNYISIGPSLLTREEKIGPCPKELTIKYRQKETTKELIQGKMGGGRHGLCMLI